MGLDMYLVGRKAVLRNWDNPEKDRTEDGFRIASMDVDLGYWRKHPNLHGYIVETFANGRDECQEISLSEADIEKIISAVQGARLPHTEGFFFGRSHGTEEEQEEDVAIFRRALAWLKGVAPMKVLEPMGQIGEGGGVGLGMYKINSPPEDQREFREVVYRASW